MKEGRKIEFDILKGLLIISVIIGHTPLNPFSLLDVYWFHMPAFFMVSGYFYKIKPNVAFREKLKRNFYRYIIPYTVFSLSLFIIFHHEPTIKFLCRVVYGGLINVTKFSFPFWYINALFISICCFNLLEKVRAQYWIVYILVAWCFIHFSSIYNLIPPLPFALELSLGAICYMYIGFLFFQYKGKIKFYNIEILIILLIICLKVFDVFNYKLDMAGKLYDHILLDFIIPFSFFVFLHRASLIISKSNIMTIILSVIGECSLTIFFSHAAILCIIRNYNVSCTIQVIICIIFGVIIHRLLNKFRLSRVLYLGTGGGK